MLQRSVSEPLAICRDAVNGARKVDRAVSRTTRAKTTRANRQRRTASESERQLRGMVWRALAWFASEARASTRHKLRPSGQTNTNAMDRSRRDHSRRLFPLQVDDGHGHEQALAISRAGSRDAFIRALDMADRLAVRPIGGGTRILTILISGPVSANTACA